MPPRRSPRARQRLREHDAAGATDAQRTLATVSYVAEGQGPAFGFWNDRDVVLVAVWPTAGDDPKRPWAPAGTWSVKIAHLSGPATEVHGWIRRNDVPFGTRARGRQSRFERPRPSDEDASGRPIEVDLEPYDGPVTAGATLNGIATGRRTIVVGAHRRDAGAPVPYPAAGPAIAQAGLQAPHRTGPDLLAPSDASAARRGVLGAGTRGGSAVRLNGTSAAAPAVTRAIARRFAAGGVVSTEAALGAETLAWPKVQAGADAPDPGRTGAERLAVPAGDERRQR
ncbi:MAG TPA: hypothetical protein VEA81_14660 [Burkholderiaceae bacterium]|nr:hypothetical protein [Burkholderiaceae bacterium]